MTRLAVVLFNLGGPDGQAAVRPFLRNLFRDPAIIGAPAFIRYPLASLISHRREKSAQANYARMGGGSPLLPQTRQQASALEAALRAEAPGLDVRVFVAMRYWAPFSEETAREVEAFAPDEIVLLPLYPQFSTSTTGSSAKAWAEAYRGPGATRTVCCYPTAEGLARGHADAIRATFETAGSPRDVRLLFSAHGLPQKMVDAGDPYRAQIEATVAAVIRHLPELPDWRICFQSRVGPLKWLEPSIDTEIRTAAADGLGVLVSPIAFVSEHVETLVELDHEYAELAASLGVAPYLRAPTPTLDANFIGALAKAALSALPRRGTEPYGAWLCPKAHGKCPAGQHRETAA